MRFEFTRWWWLAALVLLPLMWRMWRRGGGAVVRYPLAGGLKRICGTGRVWGRTVVFVLRSLAVLCMVLALAGPCTVHVMENVETEGVDIMLVMDVSRSMMAEDFKPRNRLEVAKQVVRDFIRGRRYDRMGLVVFAGEAFTQCPLTLDYDILQTFVERLHIGSVKKDGTAIGMAIATALNRLKDSKAKSKVIILLTDGANNAGRIDPLTAADLAASLGVRIYTIGVGKGDTAPVPVDDPVFGRRYVWVNVELNEEVLKQIAARTDGRYFRAVDKESLSRIFHTIDSLEKSKVKVKKFTRRRELAPRFAMAALLLLALEVLLDNTVFMKVP